MMITGRVGTTSAGGSVAVGTPVSAAGGGLLALWGAIAAWMVARAVGMVGRFATDKWEVVGVRHA